MTRMNSRLVERRAMPLQCYVIYRSPSDYPDKFVVRRWECSSPPQAREMINSPVDTVKEARALVPKNLVRFHRALTDDAVIVETWL